MRILQAALSLPEHSSNLAAAGPLLLSHGTGTEQQLDELLQCCWQLSNVLGWDLFREHFSCMAFHLNMEERLAC